MRSGQLSIKMICRLVIAGVLLAMLVIVAAAFILTKDMNVLLVGGILMFCASFGLLSLVFVFGRRLAAFSDDMCDLLDNMISGNECMQSTDGETLFAKIGHRLFRLYNIMQENRRKVDEERNELQTLVSDISHQVKMPVSNLKMVTDTLLTRDVSAQKQKEFLQGIREQVEKLDFLLQALVKSSRLETGTIRLEKNSCRLFDTLAQAMSGIMYDAEKKNIEVFADCPEGLVVSHDSKWTAEALFNLLDNAVKYTGTGGTIKVSVQKWEMYVKVDIADNGKGIPEKNHAAIFRRFYREEEVHNEPGVGIGLYLAREIITRQGGYIKVSSEAGKGAVFSVFLPNNK